jgi:putative transposase
MLPTAGARMSIPVDSTNSFACAGEVRPFDKSGAVSWISDPVPMSPISPSTRACGFLTESGFPNRLSSDSRCASGGLAMRRPYSQDLRERAVARFEAGETIRSIGKAFGVDPSCVPKWVKRRRETGSVAPAASGGRKPRTLSGDVAVWLRDRLHSGRFTTRGLAAELAERGIKTDRRAVWTFVREEGLSFKKKPVRQRAGSARRRAQT